MAFKPILPLPPEREIRVLWDGGNVLAVFKPPGLATQAPQGIDSLESILRQQLADRTEYLALPHRLDRPVSGIVLAALTKKAARLLSDQFAARKIRKTYLAVAAKSPSVGPGPWIDHLRKCPGEPRSEIATTGDASTQEAVTEVVSVRHAPTHTILKLSPVTGRMHQLRVQAASRELPIFGDVLYGCQESPEILQRTMGVWAPRDAIALAATEITFHEPGNGRSKTVNCPNELLPFQV